MTLVLLTISAVSALAFIGIVAWRPMIGVITLVLTVPLAGLGRGTVVPLLRVTEVILLLVVAGVLLYLLPRRSRRPITALDLAVAGFAIGSVLIPWLVLVLTHAETDLDQWRAVLAPAQYFALYLVFSRVEVSGRGLRLILNVAMATSVVIGLTAVAELANVPGVRDFVHTFFPPAPGSKGTDLVYRPTSLLEHFSAVGAFGVLTFCLSLSLATVHHSGFSRKWLSLVMAVNAAAVLVSQTYAPALGLVVAVAVTFWYFRRLPRQLAVVAAALLLGLALFSTQISARLHEQFPVGSGWLATPESLQTRSAYWSAFFLPALADHFWSGSGTIVPSEVPDQLVDYVDNEYLRQGFRAGAPGILLLVAVFIVIGATAWRVRASPGPWRRALGAASLASVLALALIGMTAEYLTFAGVSQQFWMMVGLLAALTRAVAPRRPITLAISSTAGPPVSWPAPVSA